ncbi:PASTA domain-containing protein [Micromonospora echinaurantiaca]|nr:PASTA domain-containing protein [Micromonospora echinaurantiaca]
MPNLVGMNAAVAEDKLKQLGLTNIRFGSQDPNDTFVVLPQNWTVTKQSHKKGTKVGLDELVVLTCTKQR